MIHTLAKRAYLLLLMLLFLLAPAICGHSNQNVAPQQTQSICGCSLIYSTNEDTPWPCGENDEERGNSHTDQLVDLEDDTDYLEGFSAAITGELFFGLSRGKSFYYDGLPEIVDKVVIPPPELLVY